MNQLGFFNIITGQMARAAEWQLQLQAGDFYCNQQPALFLSPVSQHGIPTVYGEIIEPANWPGYFYVRGFSRWCPEGEVGLFNICEATRQLSQAEFEAARAAGWPDDPPSLGGRGAGGEDHA